MTEHLVKVHIKSMQFEPRGSMAQYRPGSVQIVPVSLAREMEGAGIAMIVEDPYTEPAAPTIPYLQEEVVVVTDARKVDGDKSETAKVASEAASAEKPSKKAREKSK